MVKATKDNRPFSSGVFDLEEFNIYTKSTFHGQYGQ